MDTHHLLTLISLFALSGVQTYKANKRFSPEGNLRNLHSENDRQPGDRHKHHHHHHPHHPPPHDSMICCDSKPDVNQEQVESNRKAIMKCENETIENPGLRGQNKSVCFMNCVMKALDLTEENGRIKQRALDIIMTQHNDVINDETRKKIKEECLDKGKGPLDETRSTECNKASYNLVACAHHVKDVLCPDEKQIEGRHCDKYREEIKKMYSI